MSDYTEKITVRMVSEVHANWSEQGSDEPGKFSFQLVLDDGAVEHIARPTAQDAKVFLKLVRDSDSFYFDTEREVAIFNGVEHE